MGVFRTPVDFKLEDNNSSKSCTSLDLGGRNQSVHLATTSAPFSSANGGCEPEISSACEEGRGSFRVDAGGAELCMESTQARTTYVAAAISLPYPNCDGLETVLKVDGDRGVVTSGGNVGCSAVCSVAQPSDTTVLVSRVGAIQEVGDGGIDAADWLDVTHAMLDTLHAPDEAGL